MDATVSSLLTVDGEGKGRVLYPHRQLVHPGPYPGDVDVARRELFLLDEDFARVFGGLTRAQFDALPTWKQHQQKKEALLF